MTTSILDVDGEPVATAEIDLTSKIVRAERRKLKGVRLGAGRHIINAGVVARFPQSFYIEGVGPETEIEVRSTSPIVLTHPQAGSTYPDFTQITTQTLGLYLICDGASRGITFRNLKIVGLTSTVLTTGYYRLFTVVGAGLNLENVWVTNNESLVYDSDAAAQSPYKGLSKRGISELAIFGAGADRYMEPNAEWARGCGHLNIEGCHFEGEPLSWTNGASAAVTFIRARKVGSVHAHGNRINGYYPYFDRLVGDFVLASNPGNNTAISYQDFNPYTREITHQVMVFKTTPVTASDVAIGASKEASAINLAGAIQKLSVVGTPSGGRYTTAKSPNEYFGNGQSVNGVAAACRIESAFIDQGTDEKKVTAFVATGTQVLEPQGGEAIFASAPSNGTQLYITSTYSFLAPHTIEFQAAGGTDTEFVHYVNTTTNSTAALCAAAVIAIVNAIGAKIHAYATLGSSSSRAVVWDADATSNSSLVLGAFGDFGVSVTVGSVSPDGSNAISFRPIWDGRSLQGTCLYGFVFEDCASGVVSDLRIGVSSFGKSGIFVLTTGRHSDFGVNLWSEGGHFIFDDIHAHTVNITETLFDCAGAAFLTFGDCNIGQVGGASAATANYVRRIRPGNYSMTNVALAATNADAGDTLVFDDKFNAVRTFTMRTQAKRNVAFSGQADVGAKLIVRPYGKGSGTPNDSRPATFTFGTGTDNADARTYFVAPGANATDSATNLAAKATAVFPTSVLTAIQSTTNTIFTDKTGFNASNTTFVEELADPGPDMTVTTISNSGNNGNYDVLIGDTAYITAQNIRAAILGRMVAHELNAFPQQIAVGTAGIASFYGVFFTHTDYSATPTITKTGSKFTVTATNEPQMPFSAVVNIDDHYTANTDVSSPFVIAVPHLYAKGLKTVLKVGGKIDVEPPLRRADQGQATSTATIVTTFPVDNATITITPVDGLGAHTFVALAGDNSDVGTAHRINTTVYNTTALYAAQLCMRINRALAGRVQATILTPSGTVVYVLDGTVGSNATLLAKSGDTNSNITLANLAAGAASVDAQGMRACIISEDCRETIIDGLQADGFTLGGAWSGGSFLDSYSENIVNQNAEAVFLGGPRQLFYTKKNATTIAAKVLIRNVTLMGNSRASGWDGAEAPWGSGRAGVRKLYDLGANMADNDIRVESCYVNGRLIQSSRLDTDDFLGNDSVGQMGWTETVAGAAAQVTQDAALVDHAHRGIVTLDTGTTTTGSASMNLGTDPIVLGVEPFILEMDVYINTLSVVGDRYTVRIGLGDTTNGADFVDGVYFMYAEGTSANWIRCTANNSTRTQTASTLAVSLGWHKLRIEIQTAAASVEYFVDGVSIGTVATNIPKLVGRQCGPCAHIIKSAGTNARTFSMDSFAFTGRSAA